MSIAMKMLAEMAGITPEEIQATVADMQALAKSGVGELETISANLKLLLASNARIEAALNIAPPVEGQTNGEEIGA